MLYFTNIKIMKDGYFVAISDAHEKQRKKCLRTVRFDTSSNILQLVRQLGKVITRHKCKIFSAKIY